MATSIIKQTMNESNSNYCKMPDGTLIQWGKENSASTANRTITLPIAFVDSNYCVSGANDSGTNAIFQIAVSSKTSFAVYVSASTRLRWIAVGRWK